MDFQDYDNFEPEKKSGVPTWVWVVGGIIGLLICCFVVLPITVVALAGDSIQETFDTIAEELSTPAAVDTPELTEADTAPAPTADLSEFGDAEPLFTADFNELGDWPEGEIADPVDESLVGAIIGVEGGVYDFQAFAPETIFWVTPGEDFGDGVYEVEATAVEGPVDNGYGMLFMVDNEKDNFYAFKVSSDGFVWIGYCEAACQTTDYLVGESWFQSEAVIEELDSTNKLTVIADDGSFVFLVNDREVGRANHSGRSSGDIGMLVDTQSVGDVRVHFDNFTFTPSE